MSKVKYGDNEWKKLNKNKAFLEIIDVNLLMNVNKENVSLFDTMTKMSVIGIYSEFEWSSIQENAHFL